MHNYLKWVVEEERQPRKEPLAEFSFQEYICDWNAYCDARKLAGAGRVGLSFAD